MNWLTDTLVPISIIVILPVLIYFLYVQKERHRIDKVSELLNRYIESGSTTIDQEKLFSALSGPKKRDPSPLYLNLFIAGCLLAFVAAGILIFTSTLPADIDEDFMIVLQFLAYIALGVGLAFLLGALLAWLHSKKIGKARISSDNKEQ